MSVFGESGPKHVEVLSHPTRRRSNTGMPAPENQGPGKRMSLDSEMAAAEAGDHFEMIPPTAQVPMNQTRPAVQAPLSSRSSNMGKVIERWSSSARMSSKTTTSQLFGRPLAAEGQGSVFPIELPLSKRRALEVEIIHKFDRLDINKNVGEFWFIIDAIWMSKWVDFVMGKADPPGPISNTNLFALQTDTAEALLFQRAASTLGGPDSRLKQGLQKVRDYRAVHPLVWYIFREIYTEDDAPEVCRLHPDVYQAEVQATRRMRFSEEMHTKAVYELRRFSTKIKEEMKA